MQRIRLTYAKTEALRYTGNLDMHKIWERVFRRAMLDLAYSQGFHPQPRIQQACPLPLGYLSKMEIVDFWLNSECSVETIEQALTPALPSGISIYSIEQVDLSAPALQKVVRSSIYIVTLLDPVDNEVIAGQVQALLAANTLKRERRGKTYDLRPLIEEIKFVPCPDNLNARLLVKCSAREGATGRPDEVLLALGLDPFAARIERIAVLFE